MPGRNKRHRGYGKKRTFFIALAVLTFVSSLAWAGLRLPEPGGDGINLYGIRDIRLGIDIRGGVEAIYAPEDSYEAEANAQQLDAIVEIMGRRLDNLNILDREIYPVPEQGRVIVRFPWQSGESAFNPDEAMKELGQTAQLIFVDPAGEVVLTGADIDNAEPGFNQMNSESVVYLQLTDEGTERFRDATSRLVGEVIAIYMDEELLSAPVVNQVISGGSAYISGMETPEEAVELADSINAGALPFSIVPVSSSSISPILGQNALDVMIRAGLVSFLILAVFLIVYYRLPGFVAILTLWAQVLGILLAISIPQQTLTLQGIAGIILSIGMGVDANIIIAERIKEEVRGGTDLRTAIYYGFDRAFSSILDGNVTVAIAAVCLMFFGSGGMLSFGYSLLAGVILNLFCGAYLSQLMTRSLASFSRLAQPWLYGGTRREPRNPQEGFSFFKHRHLFASISGLIIVIGLAAALISGVELDIQFRGGSLLSYTFSDDLELSEAERAVEAVLNRDVTLQETEQLADQQKSLVVSVAGDEPLSPEEQTGVREALLRRFPGNGFEVSDVNVVDPAIGRETLFRGLRGLLIAAVLIVLYVWIRFRAISGPSAGIFALGALVHDIIIAFLVFVAAGQALNETVIAVVLSLLGWSVNDTIVIFDRIRENARLYKGKIGLQEMIDMSTRQSLSRSVNTSLASFLVMAVAFVFSLYYGIESIYAFSLPMMAGILAGSYSSITLAATYWASWMSRRQSNGIDADLLELRSYPEFEEETADPAAEEAVRRQSTQRGR